MCTQLNERHGVEGTIVKIVLADIEQFLPAKENGERQNSDCSDCRQEI